MEKRTPKQQVEIKKQATLTLHVFMFFVSSYLSFGTLLATHRFNDVYGYLYSWISSGMVLVFFNLVFYKAVKELQPENKSWLSSLFAIIVRTIERATPKKPESEMARDRKKARIILGLIAGAFAVGFTIPDLAWIAAFLISLAMSRFAEYQFNDGINSVSAAMYFTVIILTSSIFIYAAFKMNAISIVFKGSHYMEFAAMGVVGLATGYVGQALVSWFEYASTRD